MKISHIWGVNKDEILRYEELGCIQLSVNEELYGTMRVGFTNGLYYLCYVKEETLLTCDEIDLDCISSRNQNCCHMLPHQFSEQ